MKILLSTLEEITFNNLMPWLDDNSDTDYFDEILQAIDIIKIRGHQNYFIQLIEKQKTTDIAITPWVLNEWKEFTGIRRNRKIEELTNRLSSISWRDAKVSFYTFLIAHSVSAIMSLLQEQMAITSSKPLKKQLVDKYVIRLKRILEADIPMEDHREHDLLILKLTKLGALMIYLLLAMEYTRFMNPYNQLSHNDIMTALAGISMADNGLKKLANEVSQEYSEYVKKASQPPPTNKLKEIGKQDSQSTDKQDPGKQEQQYSERAEMKANRVKNGIGDESDDEIPNYNSKQLMKILNVTKGTLKRYRDKYDLPKIRSGEKGKFHYPKKQFYAWLESNPEIEDEFEIRKNKQVTIK